MKQKVKMRTPFNFDPAENTRATALRCKAPDRAQQHFKEECDINTLIQRFGIGYTMPQGLRIPQYGDFSHISSFHEALNKIAEARETFEALPAELRDRFHNDPGRFVDFAVDEKNMPELVKLGLIKASENAPAGTGPNPATPLPTPPATTPPGPAA